MAVDLAEHLIKTYRKAREYHGHDGGTRVVTEVVRESADRRPGADTGKPARVARKALRSRFSLRAAAEAAFGGWPAAHVTLGRYAAQRRWLDDTVTREAADPSVDSTAFATVVSAVFGDQLEDSYEAATSAVEELVGDYPTPGEDREITVNERAFATDKARTVGEAEEYPKTGVTAGYLTIPKAEKIGQIADITLEATERDEVAERLDLADTVGTEVGQEWAERIWKVVLGIINNFKRNGTTFNTYITSGSLWANQLTDFDQANGPEEFDRLETLFDTMVNPITGRPIRLGGERRLVVPRANLMRTRKNMAVTEVRSTVGTTEIVTGNPMGGLPAPETDPLIRAILTAAGFTATQIANFVVYGNTNLAFAKRVVRPFEVLERDNELASDVGFRQDIVYAAKARVWGAPFARRPWVVARGYKS